MTCKETIGDSGGLFDTRPGTLSAILKHFSIVDVSSVRMAQNSATCKATIGDSGGLFDTRPESTSDSEALFDSRRLLGPHVTELSDLQSDYWRFWNILDYFSIHAPGTVLRDCRQFSSDFAVSGTIVQK